MNNEDRNKKVYMTDKGAWIWQRKIIESRAVIGLAANCDDESDAVVKVYHSGESNPLAFKHEVAVHSSLRHKNVIAFLDSGTVSVDSYFIIMEHAERGDLLSEFNRLPEVAWEREARFYFPQILDGVEYLHSMGFAHGDVKPENLLLSANRVVKITDFGFAVPCNSTPGCTKIQSFSRYGTDSYMAPEVSNLEVHCPKAADVWSVGVTLLVLLTGYAWDLPHLSDAMYASFVQMDTNESPWRELTMYTFPLIVGTITPNPDARMSIKQLKSAAWLL